MFSVVNLHHLAINLDTGKPVL